MGLAIGVGVLADLMLHDAEGAEWLKKDFERLNEVLRENNLPEHSEPENLPKLSRRSSLNSFPYSFLHYLRRVAAHRFRDENWIAEPFPENENPADDPVLDSEMYMMNSHLLCHSDCEGYYVPVDFSEVIVEPGKQNRIRGGLLGSSHKLMKELIEIAPALEIEISDGKLADAEIENIKLADRAESGLFREKIVWLALFEAARLSLEHQTAIVFH